MIHCFAQIAEIDILPVDMQCVRENIVLTGSADVDDLIDSAACHKRVECHCSEVYASVVEVCCCVNGERHEL